MDVESCAEILAQPVALSETDARERVAANPLERLRSLVSTRETVGTELRYKPFYAFPVVLTKRVFRGENIVREGRIIVDGLTNISRPFTEEAIEEEQITVPTEQIIEPGISVEEALVTANGRRMQVEHRERGTMEMDETPSMVYKPVWLVELSNDDVRVVDATDGTVFGDLLLG